MIHMETSENVSHLKYTLLSLTTRKLTRKVIKIMKHFLNQQTGF